jgi:hypothetical protein
MFLPMLALCSCATTTTELDKIKERLNDPDLSEFERENLLIRRDYLNFIYAGCLSGDASYMADLMSQLRHDPDDPDLKEKLLLAHRDAFNRRDEKMERMEVERRKAERDFNASMDNLRLINSINSRFY